MLLTLKLRWMWDEPRLLTIYSGVVQQGSRSPTKITQGQAWSHLCFVKCGGWPVFHYKLLRCSWTTVTFANEALRKMISSGTVIFKIFACENNKCQRKRKINHLFLGRPIPYYSHFWFSSPHWKGSLLRPPKCGYADVFKSNPNNI